jgi:ABC-type antimicrobial peptide transport system permease subunit
MKEKEPKKNFSKESNKDFLEFFSAADKREGKGKGDSKSINRSDKPSDDKPACRQGRALEDRQNFEENETDDFLEFINEKDRKNANFLIKGFYSKKDKIKNFVGNFYGRIGFILNKGEKKLFSVFKRKAEKEWEGPAKDWSISNQPWLEKEKALKLSVEAKKEKYFEKKSTPAEDSEERIIQEGIFFVEGKKEKIQFKTLVLLSSRMFTTGGLRTFLTILGISISIGVILFLVSFGYGLQRTVLQRITTEESLLSLVARLPEGISITNDRLNELKTLEEVEQVSPLINYNGNLSVNSTYIDASIFVVDNNYFALSGVMSEEALPLSLEKGKVVISLAVAKLFDFTPETTIGKEITVKPSFRADSSGRVLSSEDLISLEQQQSKKFIVSAVVDDEITPFIYVLQNEIETIPNNNFAEAILKVHEDEELIPLKEKLLDQGYDISSISDTVEESRKIFQAIQIALAFFGLIALVISAIGMLNILTIVLLERTQEIGIMKAIGASNTGVWKMVIFDAVIIGFLGGLGGTIIGGGASWLFNFAFSLFARRIGGQSIEIFQMPPGFVLLIIVFSAIVGFVTGVWPAIRASRTSPLEAIRYK